MPDSPGIDPTIPPSGPGCVECLATGGWWFHLRRCASCGHIGCCDSSPSQHASHHAADVGHPIVQSYEPGEDWFWDYVTMEYAEGPSVGSAGSPPDRPADARPGRASAARLAAASALSSGRPGGP